MTVIAVTRTARKAHHCARCDHRIQPGEAYLSEVLPPRSDIGNTHWWRLATHLDKDCNLR